MTSVVANLISTVQDRSRRDSLLMRRIVGCAFIGGLVLLGLAFPMAI
jgi:hypothetical protein